jgi:fumarate hydratase class I
MVMGLKTSVLELIRRCSTDLPPDVEARLKRAYDEAEQGSTEKSVFNVILENVKLARENSTPICQDTGHVIFYVNYPVTMKEWEIRKELEEAVVLATEKNYLRPNAVDSVTGKNSGNNLGVNAPYITFHQWDKPELEIKLMLKGGGSENVGVQYKLPDASLKAGRDLKGVRKCIIDAVSKAQGFGCAPGTIGVGIGGDRGVSYLLSKKNFFRKMDSVNENEELAKFEDILEKELNSLGIGPMGFGGKTTVLDVFVSSQHRHPATFYVSISYMCWAFRRKAMTVKENGEVTYAD